VKLLLIVRDERWGNVKVAQSNTKEKAKKVGRKPPRTHPPL